MRIDFSGKLSDQPEIRAGFIGCGSHSFRNLYPTFQFAPVRLVATCDRDRAKAEAYATKFGADAAYADYEEMLARDDLEAVFLCTGYDSDGRPLYPSLAVDCLEAGKHVWMEKPPAATCAEIERMQSAADKAGKNAMVGLKKMFFPANEKARELMTDPAFGDPHLLAIQYPQFVPQMEDFAKYREGEKSSRAIDFLDHLCHPAALLLFLFGMPESLTYERSAHGGGLATFRFPSGALASLLLTAGSSRNGGMEHTLIVSNAGQHITIENNLRVTWHRTPTWEYGIDPSFFQGGPEKASSVWEPEFSLGQLYNKGLFLLGYYNEINEFARSILEKRPPRKGTLEQAWQVTRIFEAFAEGPGKLIVL